MVEMVKPSGERLVGMRVWIEVNLMSYCCALGENCLPRLSTEVGSTRLSSSDGKSRTEHSKGCPERKIQGMRKLPWMAFLSFLQ